MLGPERSDTCEADAPSDIADGHRRVSAHIEAGQVTLDVADDGRGISASNAARIFQPFFTTRRASGGTGMGLAVVRNLLAAHHAEISLLPEQSLTTFRIVSGQDQPA